MNREIKFRGLSRQTKDWIYGLPKYGSGGGIDYVCGWMGEDGGEQYKEVEVDYKTISQYSGIEDVNSKEYFIGDIVKAAKSLHDKYGVVTFEDGCFMLRFKDDAYSLFFYKGESGEIIGNIYENPELLTPLRPYL